MYILELPKTHPGCQDYSISSRESQPKPTKKQPSFATIASWEGNLLQRSLSAAAKEAAAASSPLFLSFGPRIKKIHRFFLLVGKKEVSVFLSGFLDNGWLRHKRFCFHVFFQSFWLNVKNLPCRGAALAWYMCGISKSVNG